MIKYILYIIFIMMSFTSCMSQEERERNEKERIRLDLLDKKMTEKYCGLVVRFNNRDYIVKRFDKHDNKFWLETPRTFTNCYDIYITEKTLIQIINRQNENMVFEEGAEMGK